MALELGGRWRACAGHPALHPRAVPRRPARAAPPPRCRAEGAGSSSGGGGSSAGSGERLPLPRKSAKLEPSLYLSPEDAVIAQLKVGAGEPCTGDGSASSHGAGEQTLAEQLCVPACPASRLPPFLSWALCPPAQALQHNSFPSPDHGIEVMYRFSAFDPFSSSGYFGEESACAFPVAVAAAVADFRFDQFDLQGGPLI